LPLSTLPCLLAGSHAQAQDLGHRLGGTLGLDAGAQGAPGIYFGDRVLYYSANDLLDRNGHSTASGLELNALANAVGVAGVIAIPGTPARWSGVIAFPTTWASARAEEPSFHVRSYGLGDITLKPVQLGLKLERASALVEYALYVPTAHFVLGRANVSQGQLTHQFTIGGSVNFDAQKRWFAGAVLSYNLNQRKIDIDIDRGDTVQMQGGVGVRPAPIWELGIAGYALWQVQDDVGRDIPMQLRGASERAYALGPDVAVRVPAISAVIRLRYELEFLVTSRPRGRIALLGITFGPSQAGTEASGEIGQ
jgi:hypothetical protein